MLMRRGVLLLAGLLSPALLGGCATGYEVCQADKWQSEDFKPGSIRKAAVVMFVSTKTEQNKTLERNKTFLEALIISLQRRGIRIVEQEVVNVAQREARLLLSRQSDVVSTREITERLGQQLALDAVIYADSVARNTVFELHKKLFGADEDEAAMRQGQVNQRGTITPEDARRCRIIAHHSVGLSLHVVDVATGEIVWVGYRHLAVSQEYDANHPEAVSTFGAVQTLAAAVVKDILGQ